MWATDKVTYIWIQMPNPPKGTSYNDSRLARAYGFAVSSQFCQHCRMLLLRFFVPPQSIPLSAPLTPGTGKRLCPQWHKKTKATEETAHPSWFWSAHLKCRILPAEHTSSLSSGFNAKCFSPVVKCPELGLAKLSQPLSAFEHWAKLLRLNQHLKQSFFFFSA